MSNDFHTAAQSALNELRNDRRQLVAALLALQAEAAIDECPTDTDELAAAKKLAREALAAVVPRLNPWERPTP